MIFKNSHEAAQVENELSSAFYQKLEETVYRRADRIFAVLLPLQLSAAVVAAIFLRDSDKNISPNVWQTIFFSAIITALPLFFTLKFPCRKITRNIVAVSQMLMAGLFIHLTGGRIETHFYIFVSLALLALYRDWKILISAIAVTFADHLVRGWLYPFSVYGVPGDAGWRWVEHIGWILFEGVILILICRQSVFEMKQIANREAELDASEKRFRAVVEQSTDGIFLLKPETCEVLNCNDAFRKIFGYDAFENIKSLNADDFVAVQENQTIKQILQDEKISFEIERNCRKKDGTLINVELKGRLILCGSCKVYCITVRDLTAKNHALTDTKKLSSVTTVLDQENYKDFIAGDERERFEKELKKAPPFLREVIENRLRHAQKLEAVGQLTAGIAREINTPVQYVADNTRFIRDAFADIKNVLEKYDGLLDAARKGQVSADLLLKIQEEKELSDLEYLIAELPVAIEQSLDGVAKITRIVQSMKDFAQPNENEKKAVDLNRAIENTLTVARNEWKYVAELETEFDESLPLIRCFAGEINQVLLNMVINAAHTIGDVVGDGSKGKGTIKIKTKKINDNWAEVKISDTGAGIPADIQSRVFDPLFTPDKSDKNAAQSLATSYAVVVDKHNGKLRFETEAEKGTTFIIELPI
ncbi:MAG: ATP-binding protein [Pyrinomonadaceae bacterium]|nr:ATP-binding protein [Pyrinomonadaceae bacterium]